MIWTMLGYPDYLKSGSIIRGWVSKFNTWIPRIAWIKLVASKVSTSDDSSMKNEKMEACLILRPSYLISVRYSTEKFVVIVKLHKLKYKMLQKTKRTTGIYVKT